jgi:hypothetical protein
MRRNIAVISFLISMMIIIAHDLIPHHHVDPNESEIISNQLTDNHEHSKTINDHNQKNHFPLHQHVLSNADFFIGRNTISLNKVLEDDHQDLSSLSALFTYFYYNTSFTGFVRLIKKPPSSYPFIISLNSTRGSPFIF